MRAIHCPLTATACLVALLLPGPAVATASEQTDAGTRTPAPLETIEIGAPAPPPAWALLERHLLEQLYPAALEFVETYTREDGTLIWRDQWPGMDGS